jgi:hypothetical protein
MKYPSRTSVKRGPDGPSYREVPGNSWCEIVASPKTTPPPFIDPLPPSVGRHDLVLRATTLLGARIIRRSRLGVNWQEC